jgi:predicted O-methyltransferase YrrM
MQSMTSLVSRAKALGIQGWLTDEEGEDLANLAINKVCCEVGSLYGLSSYCIASTAFSLICVDTFKSDSNGCTQDCDAEANYAKFCHNVNRFKNIIVIKDTSYKAAKRLQNDWFDFIFIDGDHSLKGCSQDIREYYPKIKSGGLMIFHDYCYQFKDVCQAVDKFVQKYNLVLMKGEGNLIWIQKP